MNTLRSLSTATLTALALLSGCSSVPKARVESSRIAVLPRAAWGDTDAFRPLLRAANGAQVVQLGESIHLTREMPAVRIGALRALSQDAGFDVLAVEGSAVDSWLAMDHLLRHGAGEESVREAQRRAFFGLWQTREMREVVQLVADSLTTERPLYMASFDSQLGMSVAWRKKDVIERIAEAFVYHGLPLDRATISQELAALRPIRFCFQSGFPKTAKEERDAQAAILTFEKWMSTVRPGIEKRSKAHAQALTLLPLNLRNNLALCKTRRVADPKQPWRLYQETRDRQNSDNLGEIVENVSASGKVVSWAHHSHVHYNSQGTRIPSMGQHLKRVLGIGVYTVGTFALAGTALVGQDEPALETLKDGPGIDMHPVFRSLSGEDFFIDLRSLPKGDQRFAKFFEPATVRTENEVHAAILASDFDGLIVLQQVSAPKMEF